MTLKTFPLNGTDGAAATTGNTGFSVITGGTGSTQTLLAAAAYQGSTGLRMVSNGTAQSIGRALLNASATQAAFSSMVKIPASTPGTDTPLLTVIDTAGARVVQLIYRTTGTVVACDKNNTYTTILTAGQAIAGTWFRFEYVVTALSATVGAFTARAYNTSNVQVGSTVNVSNANLGTVNMNGIHVGPAAAIACTVDIDNVQTNDGATSEIGPLSSNTTPPTVTVSANQTVTTAGSTVNVSATGTAYNGDSIAGYAWSWVDAISSTGQAISPPTITNASTANASFTLPSTKGRYRLQCVVTDTSGNVSTAVATKVFYPDTVFAPIEVVSQGAGATGTLAAVNDASDATYLDMGASGGNTQVVYRLSPITASPTGFTLTIRDLVTATGGTQQVELLDSDGTTVRKNWGAIAPGTAVADQPLTLTTGEIATVTNWSEPCLRLTQV